jgi:coenzyme F420-dependent glucose-6-phosphate dehydrogenase
MGLPSEEVGRAVLDQRNVTGHTMGTVWRPLPCDGMSKSRPVLGFHASHEQFSPSTLLQSVRHAEQAGFAAAMCSDHFHPWSEAQGQSGHAWTWLGAAMQATALPMGVVNAPGQRYHPAVVAQAAATLAEMFPGRFWMAVGDGQFLNEHITGGPWPPKTERRARLAEAVGIMRALWSGETVSHQGHVVVDQARLFTRPAEPPRLVGAALTPSTAAWVAGWADALITVSRPLDALRPILDAFRENGGEGRPVLLQVQLSFAPSHDEALATAHEQWRTNVLPSSVLGDLRMPSDFEDAATFVEPHDVTDAVDVSADPAQHAAWLVEYLDAGVDELYLHNVHHDQQTFIEVFGERVLPGLAS